MAGSWGRVLRSISNVCCRLGAGGSSKCATDLPCFISCNRFVLVEETEVQRGEVTLSKENQFPKRTRAPGDELTHWHQAHAAALSAVSGRPSSASLCGGGF